MPSRNQDRPKYKQKTEQAMPKTSDKDMQQTYWRLVNLQQALALIAALLFVIYSGVDTATVAAYNSASGFKEICGLINLAKQPVAKLQTTEVGEDLEGTLALLNITLSAKKALLELKAADKQEKAIQTEGNEAKIQCDSKAKTIFLRPVMRHKDHANSKFYLVLLKAQNNTEVKAEINNTLQELAQIIDQVGQATLNKWRLVAEVKKDAEGAGFQYFAASGAIQATTNERLFKEFAQAMQGALLSLQWPIEDMNKAAGYPEITTNGTGTGSGSGSNIATGTCAVTLSRGKTTTCPLGDATKTEPAKILPTLSTLKHVHLETNTEPHTLLEPPKINLQGQVTGPWSAGTDSGCTARVATVKQQSKLQA
uniref:Variant surface glycoprotein 1125.5162 n=1 Tax=Trypanosoma brucei TaxID=5691 RepID=A0A1J0RC88_9TRYP|nr:variant surface glycoprotein 1125.5162 [Trypanosoma brucei]